MTGGSQQLRRFRIARRDGATVEAAAEIAGMGLIEAQSWAKDDAENPPPAEAFQLLVEAPPAAQPNPAQNHKASNYARAADDWYVEPRWCVEQLADALPLIDGSYVWDPCAGGGTIPAVFAERMGGRHRVIATDVADRGYPLDDRWDATQPGCPSSIAPGMRVNVVTNPPFKQAEAIVRNLLPLVDHRLVILQQLSFLASRGRQALFADFPPSDILVLSQRPSMPPGHMIAEMGDRAFRGGTTDFCWIVWTKPHDRETRTRWLPAVERTP